MMDDDAPDELTWISIKSYHMQLVEIDMPPDSIVNENEMEETSKKIYETEIPEEGISERKPWKLRFWMVFIGQGLSLLGSSLTQFVLIWWITDNTGDISALGFAGLVALLPQALLSPVGGVFADRYNRQIIMILSDIISASGIVILIILFQESLIELWHIYLVMAVRSAMQAFQQPAATASVAMLVPASFIPRAVGLNQSLQGLMVIGAAPLGALVMASMPIGWALSIDVFTAFLGSFVLLFFTIPQCKESAGKIVGFVSQFRDGFYFLWNFQGLRHLYMLMTVVVVVIMPLYTLVPMLVKTYFGGSAYQVAVLESLAGVGMIVGGGSVAVFAPKNRVLWILAGFVGTCLFIAIVGLVPRDRFWLASTSWFLAAVFNIAGNAVFMTLIQASVPNHIQGRLVSLQALVAGVASPLGLLLATPLGEIVGTRWLFVIWGSLGAVVISTGFLSSSIRRM